jgi:hypothetical protein
MECFRPLIKQPQTPGEIQTFWRLGISELNAYLISSFIGLRSNWMGAYM